MVSKPVFMSLALSLSLLLVIGCGDDKKDSNPTTPPTTHNGTISGVVSATGGAPLSGVVVAVGTTNVTQTNEQGYFVLTGVAPGSAMAVFTHTGYSTDYRPVTVISDQTTHLPDVAMLATQSGSVDGNAGGSLDAGSGAAVEFAANSFVDGSGNPYTGQVNVELAAMAPGEAGFYGAFPGAFEGQRTDGTTVMLASFGFVDVSLFDASKAAPVYLADGQAATLRMTVPAALKAMAPPTIPMWYFDTETGTWMEEGTATLNGDTYEADVTHFTTWNWDVAVESICRIEGTVANGSGDPVAQARVISQGLETAIADEAYTDATGHFSVRGLMGETFQVRAIKGSYASEATTVALDNCPTMLEGALVLLEPAYSITLQWGAQPSDLDSHLYIPDTWDQGGGYYHIAYWDHGSLTDNPFAELDTDDTSSYGPEIISGFELYEGTFSYFVHNFSGNSSYLLANSGATVTLEIGGQTRVYHVANATGTSDPEVWHVFNFSVDTSHAITVTDVMRFEDSTVDPINSKAARPGK